MAHPVDPCRRAAEQNVVEAGARFRRHRDAQTVARSKALRGGGERGGGERGVIGANNDV
jgi:hypothetical protein